MTPKNEVGEACGDILLLGITCTRPAGHGGTHWSTDLNKKTGWSYAAEPESVAVAPQVEVLPDRCAVCGWPLADSADKGCVRGNCSMRPRPKTVYDAARANREYGRKIFAEPEPTAPSVELESAWGCLQWRIADVLRGKPVRDMDEAITGMSEAVRRAALAPTSIQEEDRQAFNKRQNELLQDMAKMERQLAEARAQGMREALKIVRFEDFEWERQYPDLWKKFQTDEICNEELIAAAIERASLSAETEQKEKP